MQAPAGMARGQQPPPLDIVVEATGRGPRRDPGLGPTGSASPGSVALGSSALDSSLFTPYQPSSLLTSLSSSLTTTLADSGPSDSVFGGRDPFGSSALAQFRPVQLTPEVESYVAALLSEGHDVEAVRVVTVSTNSGLLEAMATVERMRGIR